MSLKMVYHFIGCEEVKTTVNKESYWLSTFATNCFKEPNE